MTIELETFLVSLSGDRQPLVAVAGTCGPDAAATLTTLATRDIPADHLLFWRFAASNGMSGEGHHVVSTYKALELQPSGLSITPKALGDGRYDLTVTSTGLALHVMIEADREGRYSDNAFDLTAGESRTIRFTPRGSGEGAPVFHAYDLQSSYAAEVPLRTAAG